MGWAVLRYYAFGLTWRRSCSQQDGLEAKWERWEGAWHGSLLGMVSVPKAIQPVCAYSMTLALLQEMIKQEISGRIWDKGPSTKVRADLLCPGWWLWAYLRPPR